jgi:SAM-dependent methyltransferase
LTSACRALLSCRIIACAIATGVTEISDNQLRHDDYDPQSFTLLHEAEVPRLQRSSQILEVGAGTGYVAEGFVNDGFSNYLLGDVFPEALRYTRSTLPSVPACQFDVFNPAFQRAFDAVFLFDVIEHLEHDDLAIQSAAAILRPGGRIAITVPAHQWLWHADDRSGGHKRRYTKKQLSAQLRAAGFEIEEARYFFTLLLPFLFVRRLLSPDRGAVERPVSSDFLKVGKISNPVFQAICRLEARLGRLVPNVAGGSLLVIARC